MSLVLGRRVRTGCGSPRSGQIGITESLSSSVGQVRAIQADPKESVVRYVKGFRYSERAVGVAVEALRYQFRWSTFVGGPVRTGADTPSRAPKQNRPGPR